MENATASFSAMTSTTLPSAAGHTRASTHTSATCSSSSSSTGSRQL
jgi:hypothetical protein